MSFAGWVFTNPPLFCLTPLLLRLYGTAVAVVAAVTTAASSSAVVPKVRCTFMHYILNMLNTAAAASVDSSRSRWSLPLSVLARRVVTLLWFKNCCFGMFNL